MDLPACIDLLDSHLVVEAFCISLAFYLVLGREYWRLFNSSAYFSYRAGW